MIVWRGFGVMALVIAVLCNLLVGEGSDALLGIPEGFKHYRDAHTWIWLVSMGLSAAGCWFFGLWLEARELAKAKVLVDKETGQEVRLLSPHDLFWIPVKWWSVVWLAVGGLFMFG